MEIHNIEQYSPEWWALRVKRMTASKAQAIGANGKGLETYVRELIQLVHSKAEKPSYKNKAMDRGLELEDSAGMVYSFETGIEVAKIGFVTVGDHIGCSPDLTAGDYGLVEIKCPEDKGYLNYALDREIDTGYMWQMQMQMQICEKNWCDYVVYNPNFKTDIIITRVFPDKEKFAKLDAGYKAGIARMNEIEAQMKAL